MKKALLNFVSFIFLGCTVPVLAADTTVIQSPDKLVQCKIFEHQNSLHYYVTYKNTRIIDLSPINFSLDGQVITNQVKWGKSETYAVQEQYPMFGSHAQAENHFNGLKLSLSSGNKAFVIDWRMFNNGVAFRFIVAGAANASRIPDEATVFTIPAGSILWYHDMESHYESVHAKKEIDLVLNGEWVAPPGTYKLKQGYYAGITEADVQGYPGISLQANGKNGLVTRLPQHQRASYPYRLRYKPEDTLRLQQPAAIKGTITTPWRVVMIGANLNALVNNDIVLNLCAAPDKTLFPQGINTDWIKPGRAVWKYLDGGGQGTPEVAKKFSDGAAALGFEHNILEGFWSRWTDDEVRDVVNYSKAKKVGIWCWVHSNSLHDATKRVALFKRAHDLGIAGLKIDFFDHEAKEMIDLYDAILRECAQYKLLLDFHGANKPTGLARTYPNEMVREAVKGMEARKIEDKAKHEVTIPFTRWLAGPAEYTVVMFNERRGNTTVTHQIASAAILSAPLLTYAAHPDSILAHPAADLMKSIPAVWDETRVLPGSEIGELAIFARRKGKTWFLAVMNGSQTQQVKVPLSFLPAGKHAASIVKDKTGDPVAVEISTGSFGAGDAIELTLEAGGGYLARFTVK